MSLEEFILLWPVLALWLSVSHKQRKHMTMCPYRGERSLSSSSKLTMCYIVGFHFGSIFWLVVAILGIQWASQDLVCSPPVCLPSSLVLKGLCCVSGRLLAGVCLEQLVCGNGSLMMSGPGPGESLQPVDSTGWQLVCHWVQVDVLSVWMCEWVHSSMHVW